MNNSERAITWAKQNRKAFVENFIAESGVVPTETPSAVFMAGLPGSGKTELSRRLIETYHIAMIRIDMDEIAEQIPGYLPENADEYRGAASLLMDELLNHIFHHQLDFLLDGTFGSPKAVANIRRASDHGYATKIVYALQDPKLAWDFTRAREKIEHRAIEFDGFVETYFKIRSNFKKLKTTNINYTLDISIKDMGNQESQYHDAARLKLLDELAFKYYTKNSLIEHIKGKE